MDGSILFWKPSLSPGSKRRGKWSVSFGAIQGSYIPRSPKQSVLETAMKLFPYRLILSQEPCATERRPCAARRTECMHVSVFWGLFIHQRHHTPRIRSHKCVHVSVAFTNKWTEGSKSSSPRNNISHPFPGRLLGSFSGANTWAPSPRGWSLALITLSGLSQLCV